MMLLARKILQLRYDRTIRRARRVLRVRPLDSHASWRGSKYLQQHALGFEWRCEPLSSCEEDEGTLVLYAQAAHDGWRFEMRARVEIAPVTPQVLVAREQNLGRWLLPSRLCERTPRLCEMAHQAGGEGLELARELNRLTHRSLLYREGTTDGETSAARALDGGAGVCQDFAHLLVALCRARGVAARYVSGFGHADGRMHAWVEVWSKDAWHALDPTHGGALDERAIAVAVGRDFRDVQPLQGSFEASGRARAELKTFCSVRSEGESRGARRYNEGELSEDEEHLCHTNTTASASTAGRPTCIRP